MTRASISDHDTPDLVERDRIRCPVVELRRLRVSRWTVAVSLSPATAALIDEPAA